MDDFPIIPFSQLPLSDNFMFGEVMRDEKVCKLFLEALFQKKIARIVVINKEQDLGDDYLSHGIRLDVYLEDANGTRYDIEMQKINMGDLERRSRYYQSGIDRRALEKGDDYANLPESYVIFVCDFDPYKLDKACYKTQTIIEDTDLIFDDGSHVLILNAGGGEINVTPEMAEYLRYVRTNDDQCPFSSLLAREARRKVNEVRHNKAKEVSYMTFAAKMRDERKYGWTTGMEQGMKLGMEKGMEEGREAGQLEMLLHSVKALMARQHLTAREAMELLGVPAEEQDRALEQLEK